MLEQFMKWIVVWLNLNLCWWSAVWISLGLNEEGEHSVIHDLFVTQTTASLSVLAL